MHTRYVNQPSLAFAAQVPSCGFISMTELVVKKEKNVLIEIDFSTQGSEMMPPGVMHTNNMH